MALVSVILSAYNAESYIEKSVSSILNQTYKNIELIVIDDGSTDSTLTILKTFSTDKRLIIHSRENRGLTKSLNEAIRMATGYYIARQDADDYSYLDRIEKQVEFIKNNNSDFVFSQASDGQKSFPTKIMLREKITSAGLSFGNVLTHGTLFSKAAILKQNQYNENFRFAQDYELWLRLLKNGYNARISFEPLYFLYRNDLSITVTNSVEQESFARRALIEQLGDDKNFISKGDNFFIKILKKIKKRLIIYSQRDAS